ncbi:MAG: hypothetical protein JWR05_599 [Mucilaginibacter sp.]|nr:hypothetical protein [Mucilaginibacter sp.]
MPNIRKATISGFSKLSKYAAFNLWINAVMFIVTYLILNKKAQLYKAVLSVCSNKLKTEGLIKFCKISVVINGNCRFN